MNTKNLLDGIINADVDVILGVIRNITTSNMNNYKKLKEIVTDSDFSNKYEILDVSEKLFVSNIVVCLLYSSIDPFLVNTPIMKQYQEKVVKVSNELGLNQRNIVPVSSIEEKLYSVLL